MFLSGSNFTNNHAINYGGAIHNQANDINVSGSNFIANTANLGGAIYNQLGDNVVVQYNRFLNNSNYIIANDDADLKADFNWWGSNGDPNPHVDGVAINYWFVMTFVCK
jgi:hypothetical protein